jgi:lipid-binding SYLF domain-containing protein
MNATKSLFLGAAAVALALAGCRTAPESAQGKADICKDSAAALVQAKASDPRMIKVCQDAYGSAVFPKVSKGAAGVGGAYGKGVLYKDGKVVGYCDLSQASVGFQLGAQTYSEILCFEDQKAFDRFKAGTFTFDAQATAVALESGAGANAKYNEGVSVFTMDEKGLMFEAAVGGQKFSYQAL